MVKRLSPGSAELKNRVVSFLIDLVVYRRQPREVVKTARAKVSN
jgi:hypothetical protein